MELRVEDDVARDRAYSQAIGSAFASHPFLISRVTTRTRNRRGANGSAGAGCRTPRGSRCSGRNGRISSGKALDAGLSTSIVPSDHREKAFRIRHGIRSYRAKSIISGHGELVERRQKKDGIPWNRETILRMINANPRDLPRRVHSFRSIIL